MKLQVTYLFTISFDLLRPVREAAGDLLTYLLTYLLTISFDLLRSVREAAGDLLTYLNTYLLK